MLELLSRPWPWYAAGPLIGLFAPLLLLFGNKVFGVSGSFRNVCAVVYPRNIPFFQYDWRREGLWKLVFAAGIIIGGFIGGVLLANPEPIAIAAQTRADLAALGVQDFSGFVPRDVFSWEGLLTLRGLVLIVGGGFLIGFGSAYAAGCTSGHGISGLAALQLPSLVAVTGFFLGGIFTTYLLLPLIF